ncbi:MAG TPA: TIGR03435 family protein [Candidatus Sulfopaludibacter sp.]|jgi:uncharacterized protein (TIGR03435 family)|nr:TIGR03435 family protein [Candidatus Sulfopaludibacter sp.]
MVRTSFLLAILAASAASQTFDVASVKRISLPPPRGGLKREITPTGVSLHTATIGNLLEWAYGMTIYQVVGPNWLNWPTDAAYDVDAKTSTPTTEAVLKRMLQALLQERFQLQFHRETRDTVIYALVTAKGGPKMRKSTSTGEPKIRWTESFGTVYERMPMAQFAFSLERPFQPRHVADETGLTGTFDFTLDLAQYLLDPVTGEVEKDSIGRLDEAGALIRALPQQIGLALQRKTVPMEVLVIDHLEKNPTAN